MSDKHEYVNLLSSAQKKCEDFAAEQRFNFFIFNGIRYEYRGWKSEERDATEEEMEMWTRLGGPYARFDLHSLEKE